MPRDHCDPFFHKENSKNTLNIDPLTLIRLLMGHITLCLKVLCFCYAMTITVSTSELLPRHPERIPNLLQSELKIPVTIKERSHSVGSTHRCNRRLERVFQEVMRGNRQGAVFPQCQGSGRARVNLRPCPRLITFAFKKKKKPVATENTLKNSRLFSDGSLLSCDFALTQKDLNKVDRRRIIVKNNIVKKQVLNELSYQLLKSKRILYNKVNSS